MILTNQNKPIGYAAEAQLCLDILDRFYEVPWKPKWREAYEADLTKAQELLQSATDEGGA